MHVPKTFFYGGEFIKFLANKKLAARIGIITTAITLVGMLLLWVVVSTDAAATVKSHITNQMTDAVESRAAIIDDYVLSAEEYMTAFALGSEVHDLLQNPSDRRCCVRPRNAPKTSPPSRAFLRGCTSQHRTPMFSLTPLRGPSA